MPIPGPAEVRIRVMELRDSLHPMDYWGLKLEMVLALIDYPNDPPPGLLIKYLGLRERLRAGLPPLIVRTEEEKARLVADHATVMAELAARGYRGSIPMSPD